MELSLILEPAMTHPRQKVAKAYLACMPLDDAITHTSTYLSLRIDHMTLGTSNRERLRNSRRLRESDIPGYSSVDQLDGVPFEQHYLLPQADAFPPRWVCDGSNVVQPEPEGVGSNVVQPQPEVDQALVLHVELSESSAFEYNGKPVDIKLEVFFNGMLTDCFPFNRPRLRREKKPRDKNPNPNPHPFHRIIAGTRVSKTMEQAWILRPPGRGVGVTSAEPRWTQICEALMKESNDRGLNDNRESCPSANYLKSLASMSIPAHLNFKKKGELTLGVVDVVITAGLEKEIGNAYLEQPERIPDPRFKYKQMAEEDVPVTMQPLSGEEAGEDHEFGQDIPGRSSRPEPTANQVAERPDEGIHDSDRDAEGGKDPEFEQSLSDRHAEGGTEHTLLVSPTMNTKRMSTTKGKRPSGDISDLDETKGLSPSSKRRQGIGAGESAPEAPSGSLWAPEAPSMSSSISAPESASMSDSLSATETASMPGLLLNVNPPTEVLFAGKPSSVRAKYDPLKRIEIPPLNRNSVITYPATGQDGYAILRNAIRQHPTGEFTEEAVVAGIRFYVSPW